MGAAANRTATEAASPAPFATSVKVSVAEVSFTAATARFVTALGATATTVMESRPAMPAIVALTAAVPGLTAVARPVELTVRTVVSELVQPTRLPVIVPPSELSGNGRQSEVCCRNSLWMS